MSRVLYAVLMLAVCASLCFAEGEAKSKIYGKPISVKEVTSLKSINADPQVFVDKEVLVAGKVAAVCKGRGCWVEIVTPDNEKIICKSLDESVTVPMDCEGKMIEVQGKVVLDKKASGKAEMHKEGNSPAHACPAPKVLVSMEGASFIDAPVAPAAMTPATTTPIVIPATEKKEAPAATEVKPVPATEKKEAPAATEMKAAPATEKKDAPAPVIEKKLTPAPEKKDAPATPPTPTK